MALPRIQNINTKRIIVNRILIFRIKFQNRHFVMVFFFIINTSLFSPKNLKLIDANSIAMKNLNGIFLMNFDFGWSNISNLLLLLFVVHFSEFNEYLQFDCKNVCFSLIRCHIKGISKCTSMQAWTYYKIYIFYFSLSLSPSLLLLFMSYFPSIFTEFFVLKDQNWCNYH